MSIEEVKKRLIRYFSDLLRTNMITKKEFSAEIFRVNNMTSSELLVHRHEIKKIKGVFNI